MEEKSMKKRSFEKPLDGMQQSTTKFEHRGEKYEIAVSYENLCSLIPIHHGMYWKHRKQLNNHIIIIRHI